MMAYPLSEIPHRRPAAMDADSRERREIKEIFDNVHILKNALTGVGELKKELKSLSRLLKQLKELERSLDTAGELKDYLTTLQDVKSVTESFGDAEIFAKSVNHVTEAVSLIGDTTAIELKLHQMQAASSALIYKGELNAGDDGQQSGQRGSDSKEVKRDKMLKQVLIQSLTPPVDLTSVYKPELRITDEVYVAIRLACREQFRKKFYLKAHEWTCRTTGSRFFEVDFINRSNKISAIHALDVFNQYNANERTSSNLFRLLGERTRYISEDSYCRISETKRHFISTSINTPFNEPTKIMLIRQILEIKIIAPSLLNINTGEISHRCERPHVKAALKEVLLRGKI